MSRPLSHHRLSLRSSVLWTLLGNAAFNAAQFTLVAALAHLGSPREVGLYALGLSITAPIFLLSGLQLRSVQATDAEDAHPFGSYFTLRCLSMLLAFAATLALLPAYPAARAVLLGFAAAKLLEGISDVLYGRLQREDRLDQVSLSLLLRGGLGLLLPLTAYLLTHSVGWLAAGVALANLLVLLAYDLPRTAALRPGRWWTVRDLGALLRVSWPLAVVMGLVSLNASLPRLVVERDLGAHDLGLYSALGYVNTAGMLVVGAIGTALTTRLARAFADRERGPFLRATGLFVLAAALVGAAVLLLALVAGGPLLRLLFGAEYARQQAAFVWLSLAGVFVYAAACAGFAVTAARRFVDQLPLFAVVTLVLYGACLWLVPAQGLVGAALATLLSAVVQLAGSWWIVWRALRGLSPAPERA